MQTIDRPSRRRFIARAGSGVLALSLPGPLRHALADSAPQNAITPQAALDRLMAGNARYAAGRPLRKDFTTGRAARAQAQYPIASILSCADSRVAPELLFDQGPGDLFVVRVAGNYLNQDVLASLEYGVAVLGTPLVMVLGHSGCGAVKATIQEIQTPRDLPGHIWDITDALKPGIAPVVKAGGEHMLERATRANVEHNVARVAAAQPLLSRAVQDGRARVVGAEFDLASDRVRLLGNT